MSASIVRLFSLASIFVLMTNLPALANDPIELPLWPEGVPGPILSDDDTPTLTVYLPDPAVATGAAVVICPGGGYVNLAMDHEGHDVARWLNSIGVAAFIVKYRRGAGYQHPAPIQDAQRAIRTVRARANEWQVDTNKVGVLGFSAGGHLASTTGTHFDKTYLADNDPVDAQSARPDFMVLIYPVISLTTEYTHQGSKHNLLGKQPSDAESWAFSNELQVSPETPPTFLVHTTEDTAVPPENSILFYMALRKAGVSAEMHIYERGRHGLGMAPSDPAMSTWTTLCATWMQNNGWL